MFRSKWIACLMLLVVLPLTALSCKSRDDVSATRDAAANSSSSGPQFCAALRGNGQYIFTHFGSLARVVEEYGLIDGMAGGSSSSLTTFLYESMLINPLIAKYDGLEKRLRVSLMLKSVLGYLDAVKNTDEFHALSGLTSFQKQLQDGGIDSVVANNSAQAKAKLASILSDPGVRALVNPEIKDILLGEERPKYVSQSYKIQEIKTAVTSLTAFAANDQRVLFRSGAISLPTVVKLLGRIADFYAARPEVDQLAMGKFFDECGGPSSLGLDWEQVSALPFESSSCGTKFSDLVKDYRDTLRKNNFVAKEPRLKDTVGAKLPSILVSAYVENPAGDSKTAPEQYLAALARYRNDQPVDYDVDFNNVHFGYWTSDSWRANLAAALAQSSDAKVKKYRSLTDTSPLWGELIPYSIMEPGLSRMLVVGDRKVFIGGWADLHPVQPLKAAGCQSVIYISRQGPESKFVSDQRPLTSSSARVGVAELLNMTPSQQFELYLEDNPNSSYNSAVRSADAVWCTNWDIVDSLDFKGMFKHSYDSRIATKSSRFSNSKSVKVVPAPQVGCY